MSIRIVGFQRVWSSSLQRLGDCFSLLSHRGPTVSSSTGFCLGPRLVVGLTMLRNSEEKEGGKLEVDPTNICCSSKNECENEKGR